MFFMQYFSQIFYSRRQLQKFFRIMPHHLLIDNFMHIIQNCLDFCRFDH